MNDEERARLWTVRLATAALFVLFGVAVVGVVTGCIGTERALCLIALAILASPGGR